MAVRYNGTLVQAAYTTISVVDAQPVIGLDAPDTTTNYLGGVTFGGWAVDHVHPVSYIQVSIDGRNIGNASYGGGRQDVCNVYPAAQSCPNVGYSIWWNTTTVSGGTHNITITAVDTSGDSASVSRTFKTQQAYTNYSIDTPDSSTTYMGEAHFGGWALDNAFPISSVVITIDDQNPTSADYGGNRQDACNVYGTSSPGCPNVGWNKSIDISSLLTGPHTFAITVTTSDGRQSQTSKQFNVQHVYTNIGVDKPQANATYFGAQTFSGWAVDDAFPISSVGISIDGQSYGNAAYGGNRSDVCNTYPGRPGCPNVGWSIPINVDTLPAKTHSLVVTATAADGRQQAQSVNFVSVHPAVNLIVDTPQPQRPYSGTVNFAGWAYESVAAISSIDINIDGTDYGNASYGGARPDVCSAGQYPGCPNVGWNFNINTAQLSPGPHQLTVTATGPDSQSIKSVQFSVGDQSLPAREYIYQNGKLIVIENHP